MVSAFPRPRTAYLVGNGLAIAITFIAGFVNRFIGPRNLGILFIPLFEAGFATVTFILVDAVLRVKELKMASPPLRLGPVGVLWKWLVRWNGLIVSTAFLCVMRAFCFIFSSVLLYAAITGTVDP